MKLLALLAFVALAAAAVTLLIPQSQPPARALPNPNGYDDFVRAAMTIVAFPDQLTPTNRQQLQSHIATNSEPLRLVHLGLTKECRLSWGSGTNSVQQHIDELSALKALARLLESEARLAELEQRTNEAARIHLETVRFGNEAVRGGVVIDKLVGLAIANLGITSLERLQRHLDPQTRRETAKTLRQIDKQRESAADVVRHEKQWVRANFDWRQRLITWIPIPALNQTRKVEQNLVSKIEQQEVRQKKLMTDLDADASDQGLINR